MRNKGDSTIRVRRMLLRPGTSSDPIAIIFLLFGALTNCNALIDNECEVTSLSMTPKTTTLSVGQTDTLTANASLLFCTTAQFSWTSADPSVAAVIGTFGTDSVSSAVVRGVQLSSGPISIGVLVTPHGRNVTTKSENADVTVIAPPPVPVDHVAITGRSSIDLGDPPVPFLAQTLDAAGNVLTGRAITWSSSDNNIATVDPNGLVTALSTGNVTISAQSESKAASIAVTIRMPPGATIAITPPTLTLNVLEATQLHASAKDANAATIGNPLPTAFTWTSRAPQVASVSPSGVVTALGVGSATVDASLDGITGSATVTVSSVPIPVAQRFAYALADQKGFNGTYAASPTYAFNSSGGTIQIARLRVGVYSVTFPAQGRPVGGADVLLVSAVGQGNGSCKPLGWQGDAPQDFVANVACFDFTGQPADNDFSIMLLGEGALPGRFAITYADQSLPVGPYDPAVAYNSGGQPISVAPTPNNPPLGSYEVTFKGNPRPVGGSPEALLLGAALSGSARRCTLATWLVLQQVSVRCFEALGPASPPRDSRFMIALLDHGRPNLRAAFVAATSTPAGSVPILTQSFSSSGAVQQFDIQRKGVGLYDVVFKGLARQTALSTENVQVVVRQSTAAFCVPLPWQNASQSDLVVRIQCYKNDGTPDDNVEYGVLVLQ